MISELNILISNNGIDQHMVKDKFSHIFLSKPDYTLSNHLMLSGQTASEFLKHDDFQIFVHGEIYEGTHILKLFQQYIDKVDIITSALCKLNGSFIILLVCNKTSEVYIITDRINSKRLFFYQDVDYIIMTTNPIYFKQIDCEINLKGVASYLINGVIYENNTLYKHIHALERARMYKIENQQLTSLKYWDYAFTNEYEDLPIAELKKEFSNLLMRSVEKRLQAVRPERVFLSLSGGYDSRFLLGALRKLDSKLILKTFSYGMDNKLESGDDIIAKKLAVKFGFDHHFIKAYGNDLLAIIKLNVEFGYGMANFCDEVDAWMRIHDDFKTNPSSLLFVGDMFSHSSPDYNKISDARIPLKTVAVFPWFYILPLLDCLSFENQIAIKDAYDELYSVMLSRLPETEDYQIIKDFAYIDQRVSHTLMYWRDFFHGPFIRVAQPLLDNQILDFHRKLPNRLRYNKLLYKEVVRDMFPELFDIPIAHNIWAYPSWAEEIQKNNNVIIKKLSGSRSRLDEIIPLNVIMSLINDNGKFRLKYKTEILIRLFTKISRTSDFAINLFGPLLLKHSHIKRSQLIIRLLILREALEY